MTAVQDHQGLTTLLSSVLVAPARVRFHDPVTGAVIAGLSEPKIDPNHMRIHLKVEAFAPCVHEQDTHHQTVRRIMGHYGWSPPAETLGNRCFICGALRELTGVREGPANLFTNTYAKLSQAAIFGQTTTVTDTGSTGRSVTKTVDGGINVVTGAAGTGGTTASVADIALQTETETTTSVTINAVTGTGASGSFTMVYTVTATAARAYQECGLRVTTTTSGWVFLMAHDSFATLNVSLGGTLQTTYTVTNS